MPVKVNVGLSRKVGQPDFGSSGASCQVEFELDGGFDNGSSAHFQDAVRRAYQACRQAVESQIAANQSPAAAAVGSGRQPATPAADTADRSSHGNGRSATASQVRAIQAIAKRSGVDLAGLLQTQFGLGRPENLSIREASGLIDKLKGSASGSTNVVSP